MLHKKTLYYNNVLVCMMYAEYAKLSKQGLKLCKIGD